MKRFEAALPALSDLPPRMQRRIERLLREHPDKSDDEIAEIWCREIKIEGARDRGTILEVFTDIISEARSEHPVPACPY